MKFDAMNNVSSCKRQIDRNECLSGNISWERWAHRWNHEGKMPSDNNPFRKTFTLIELLVVIAIITILPLQNF